MNKVSKKLILYNKVRRVVIYCNKVKIEYTTRSWGQLIKKIHIMHAKTFLQTTRSYNIKKNMMSK